MKYLSSGSVQKRVGGVFVGLVVAVGASGCGGVVDTGVSRTDSSTTVSDAELIKEAAEFGGLVLPADVTVLGVDSMHGIDSLYQLAISTDQDGLDELLVSSAFSAPLERTFTVAESTVAGPPLETSPLILRGQERYRRADGKSVARIVIVDERDPVTRIVHLQVFDT
ncbi:hypothetical protein [Rhodococcus gannanensis]|uniref:Lipoprotein n=1 Tax=Rhodococcus gannanensis TaxID=1960308 RepID=A0ABW4P491_9NOCA